MKVWVESSDNMPLVFRTQAECPYAGLEEDMPDELAERALRVTAEYIAIARELAEKGYY